MEIGDRTLPPEFDPFGRTAASNPGGAAPASAELTRLGRYVLIAKLGSGGMGVVYSAYDPQLDRKVAVKLLLPGLRSSEQARLLREARAMARLSHPNVVAVHDAGEHDGRVYVAMDFVKGETLRAWVARGSRGWQETTDMFARVGAGIAAAHEIGIVHRDVKPDNVLVDERGRPLVTDFGLARTDMMAIAPGSGAVQSDVDLTDAGALVGTPAYMAPEQFAGAAIDHRADQFSFCVALWESLFGSRPFAGDSAIELATNVMEGRLRPAPRGRVPRWLQVAVERGLAKDPSARWPGMDALLAELRRGHGRSRTRRRGAAMVTLVALVCGGVIWHFGKRSLAIARCDAEADAIGHTWPGVDGGQRSAVDAHLRALGVSYLSDGVARLDPWLEGMTAAWADAMRASCRAFDVDHSVDEETHQRSRECLEERRLALAMFLEHAAELDASQAPAIVRSAASLQGGRDCSDPSLLARSPALPPELREGASEIRAAVARGLALGDAGDATGAVATLERAVDDAEDLGWAPLRVRARVALGSMLERKGDYASAETELIRAYLEAGRAGVALFAAQAATGLTFVVGAHRARFAEGRLWAEIADVELLRIAASEDDVLATARLVNLALLEQSAGEAGRARDLLGRALVLRERTLGPTHPEVAQCLFNLATVEFALGDYVAARANAERALAIEREAYGAEHPDVAMTLGAIGGIDYTVGNYVAAADNYRRALAIQEAALGGEHPSVGMTLSNLALVEIAAGSYDAARRIHLRASPILERALGADHPDFARVLDQLALIESGTKAHARAKQVSDRALAIKERALGPAHPEVAVTLINLANAEFELGEVTAAREHCERALATNQRELGEEHLESANALHCLARAQSRLGETDAARANARRALAAWRRQLGPDDPRVIATTALLAEISAPLGARSGGSR
ncbi:MAG: tetratricopeptide repeat protein [Nannocystaceae bacterium]